MKVVVVGGGSTYTPELIGGIARRRAELPVTEIVLVDPAADRRTLLAGVAQRMLRRAGHPAVIIATDNVRAATDGAAAVLLQLRVGGQAARARDESWPLECGCVGQETTGAGGLAKALRTVPVVLDIASQVRDVNPDAWIVDFTNPVGIVTRALLQAGHRAVGLCNVAIGLQRYFAGLLDLPAESVALDHVGLNHLSWVRGVRSGADPQTDLLPGMLAAHGPAIAEKLDLPQDLIQALGIVPSYYLKYFYLHDAVVEQQRTAPSRAERVAAIESELLALYADPTLDHAPDLLAERGGAFYSDAAVELLASLVGTARTAQIEADADHAVVRVVNVRNGSTLPFLPPDMVIETPCAVDASGAVPLPVAPVDPATAGLISHVAGYEMLALSAALHGGRDRVSAALLAHPLIGQWDTALALTDRLLAENRAFLPWA